MKFVRRGGVVALVSSLCATAVSAASLPRLEADTLGGTHVVLPTDAQGTPLILLLAFTRESEPELKRWSRSLLADRARLHVGVYVVVVADRTAFVSRRHIRSLVENAAVGSKDDINAHVMVTFDGTGWRDLVAPGDNKTAGVVVCDSAGTIVFAKREFYSDANLAEVEKAAK